MLACKCPYALAVELDVTNKQDVERKASFNALSSLSTKLFSQIAILQNADDGISDFLWIVRIDQKSVFTILN